MMSLKDWINDGEKFALVGLSVRTSTDFPHGRIAPNLWVLSESRLVFPEDWTNWLGTIRAENVADSNLLLMTKQASQTPDILDGENQTLEHLVGLFYVGLLLASSFAAAHKPVMITGSRRGDDIGIRQSGDFDTPVPREFRPYPSITGSDIEDAARLGLKILEMEQTRGRWRFFRVLHLYQQTRTIPDLLERIHQYARCIDGLILPAPGRTKQQFKSRTELFIGPGHHDFMGELYDVRSAVEHLHINRYLGTFNRDVRLELLKKEAIAGYIARTSLARIIDNPALWGHFSDTASLETFWTLNAENRKNLWGPPIAVDDALQEFNPEYISDAMLGKTET